MRTLLLLTVAVSACVLSASSELAQPPTFTSRIEAVRVDVLVTDRGKEVRGLGRDDFEVLDNGVPQTIELVSFEQIPLNVVLVLDMSASVAGERLQRLRDAGRALLGGLTRGDVERRRGRPRGAR